MRWDLVDLAPVAPLSLGLGDQTRRIRLLAWRRRDSTHPEEHKTACGDERLVELDLDYRQALKPRADVDLQPCDPLFSCHSAAWAHGEQSNRQFGHHARGSHGPHPDVGRVDG